jgi:hypothetical protein
LISVDRESKKHLAHCLNFDLMECGNSADEAWENLKGVVKHFIEYSYTNNPESLTVSADAADWKRFAEALKDSTKPERVDSISIEYRPPLPELSAPIWMQGVNGDGRACALVQ